MQDFMFTTRQSFKGKFIVLFFIIALLLGIGTLVFHFAEDWSYVDAFYYSSISLSSRGYGELHPTTSFSKIFTVFYLFIGVAFILYALSSLIGQYMHSYEPAISKKMNSIVKSISPNPKKDKWVVLKAPEQNPGIRPKFKF